MAEYKFTLTAEGVGSRRRRAGGRPARVWVPASVESVRLDPELKREPLLRASKDGISVSEVIREALRSYVRAN